MIKKILNITIIVLGLQSCTQWINQTLVPERPVNHAEYVKPIPAEQRWKNLVITDFSKQSFNWRISHPAKMAAKLQDSVWAVNMNNVGPDYEEITMSFPPTDFTNVKNVILTAAADGYIPPYIRFDITDKNGFSTNFKVTLIKVVPSDGFYDYKLNFNGKYIQSWPSMQKVDSSNIVQIKMNINPPHATKNPYTGQIQFRSMKIVPFRKPSN